MLVLYIWAAGRWLKYKSSKNVSNNFSEQFTEQKKNLKVINILLFELLHHAISHSCQWKNCHIRKYNERSQTLRQKPGIYNSCATEPLAQTSARASSLNQLTGNLQASVQRSRRARSGGRAGWGCTSVPSVTPVCLPPTQHEGSNCVPTQSQEAAWPSESRLVVRKRSASLWARVQRTSTTSAWGRGVKTHSLVWSCCHCLPMWHCWVGGMGTKLKSP